MGKAETIQAKPVVKTPQQKTAAKAATPFFSPVIQPKLTINQPNDLYEQEADAVADKVMRMTDHEAFQMKPAPVNIQKKCEHCEEKEKLQEEEETIQRKCAACEDEELHRKESDHGSTPAVSPAVYQTIQSGGSALDEDTRSFMESRFNQDFSGVQIHNDSLAHRSAKEINARAYTHGQHIVFGPGQYQPDTQSGKQLLAHELAHVMQQGHNEVRRQPGPVKVPSTENVEEWTPKLGEEFLWKNPDLRKIIYPQREDSLRAFLEIVKSFELKGFIQGSQDIAEDDLEQIFEKDKEALNLQIEGFNEEKSSLETLIKDEKEDITRLETERKQAEKDLKALLKPGTDTAKINAAKDRIEKGIKTLANKIEAAQKNLDWVELKEKRSGIASPKDKEFWEKRKTDAIKSRDDLTTELEPVMKEYEELIAPTESLRNTLAKEIGEKKQSIKNSENRIKTLRGLVTKSTSDLGKITGMIGSLKKRKEKPGKEMTEREKRDLREWRLKQYRNVLIAMDHDALLKEVIEVFEKQGSTDFFPPWMQYAIIHFSGMRYATAHGTWEENPQSLLFILKDIEIGQADEEGKKVMMGDALKGIPKADAAKIDALWKTLKRQLRGDDIAAFEKLKPLLEELKKHFIELAQLDKGSDAFKETIAKITATEEKIDALQSDFTEAGLKKVMVAREGEKKSLIELFRAKAKKQLKALSTAQALTLLKQMHKEGQIPDFAWKEITSFTELRLEIPADELVSKANKELKNVTLTPDIDPAEFTRWKSILKAWYASTDKTAWRKEQAKTLNVSIVTSLVCDQIGSIVQHARGLQPAGGLRKNALFYYDLAKGAVKGTTPAWDKKTVCPPAPGSPMFKKPVALEDFPCGASVFWMDWSELKITDEYLAFYKKTELPVLRKIRELADKRKQLLKSDPKKELAAVEKELHEWNVKRNKMNADRDKMKLFKPQEKKGFAPDFSQIVAPFPEPDLKILDTEVTYKEKQSGSQTVVEYEEAGFEIKDGLKRNGWHYSINKDRHVEIGGKPVKVESVMRVKPNPNAGVCPQGEASCPLDFTDIPDPKLIKQWLVWRHQATVLFVKPPSTVITFDTSGRFNGVDISGLTVMERPLHSLTGDKNVFVGFAPGKSKDLTEFLEEGSILNTGTVSPAKAPGQDE